MSVVSGNPPPPRESVERSYVTRYSQPVVGLIISIAGQVGDPDGQIVNVTMTDDTSSVIFSGQATRNDIGDYVIQLPSSATATVGYFTLNWSFNVATVAKTAETYLEIGGSDPYYDSLDPNMQSLVDNVWWRFEDLFDGPAGGPNLQVYFQTNFTRGKIARLAQAALNKINLVSQPTMRFQLTGSSQFPLAAWGGLLEQATYIEVIRHLIRSYVEQPMTTGVNVAALDRRDYMQRWQAVLEEELQQFQPMLDSFKISYMGLARARVLVGGGVFGRYGPTRLPGSAVARPRYFFRFY